MRAPWSALACAALLLLAAGCSGPAPADAVEGGQGPDGATRTSRAAGEPGADLAKTFTIAEAGQFGGGVCVPDPAGGCTDRDVIDHDVQVFAFETGQATAWTGWVVLSWEDDALYPELILTGAPFHACGARCMASSNGIVVQGASPLRLEVSYADTGEDRDGFQFAVHAPSQMPAPLQGGVEAPLEFRLEGTLTATLAPPA